MVIRWGGHGRKWEMGIQGYMVWLDSERQPNRTSFHEGAKGKFAAAAARRTEGTERDKIRKVHGGGLGRAGEGVESIRQRGNS